MKFDLLEDCRNLAEECLHLVNELEKFAFPNIGMFLLDEYALFLRGKNVNQYLEHLRLLANKVHGLKGVVGFMIPEAKTICHRSEDVIKPLADGELILDDKLFPLLTSFVFTIQGVLEDFEKSKTISIPLDEWSNKFEVACRRASKFLENQEQKVRALLDERSRDSGEIRKRERRDSITVDREGYEELRGEVNTLYQMISTVGVQELVGRASKIYNAFLDHHQNIKNVTMDMSRYQRLVPTLAEKYQVRAKLMHIDDQVAAESDFWAVIHEICNHLIKNSITHGIEKPLERLRSKKEETGRITVTIRENALQIKITVSDDGKGIDEERLVGKAIENNVISSEMALSMSKEEKLGLVFAQGVSTREELDDNAGRGIGMNAVQEAMQRLQGTCRITSEKGKGTQWDFSFPKLHVSISCFIVAIEDYVLALPEHGVRLFGHYDPRNLSTFKGRPVYRHNDLLIPLIENREVFALDRMVETEKYQQVVVVESGKRTCGIRITNVFDKAILPVSPLSNLMVDTPLFIGTTIHENSPLMVLNTSVLGDYL